MWPSLAPISQLLNKLTPTSWLSSFEIQFTSRAPSRSALSSQRRQLRAGQAFVTWVLSLTSSSISASLCLTGKMSCCWSFVRQSQLLISFWPFNLNVLGDSAGDAYGIRHHRGWARPLGWLSTLRSPEAAGHTVSVVVYIIYKYFIRAFIDSSMLFMSFRCFAQSWKRWKDLWSYSESFQEILILLI